MSVNGLLAEFAASHDVPVSCQTQFAANRLGSNGLVEVYARAPMPLTASEDYRWQTPMLDVHKAVQLDAIARPFLG